VLPDENLAPKISPEDYDLLKLWHQLSHEDQGHELRTIRLLASARTRTANAPATPKPKSRRTRR